jgi:hypothetical protein
VKLAVKGGGLASPKFHQRQQDPRVRDPGAD